MYPLYYVYIYYFCVFYQRFRNFYFTFLAKNILTLTLKGINNK